MKQIILVGIGGGVGSILRYLVQLVTNKYYGNSFPLGTFTVNMIGCLLIGLVLGYFTKNQNIPADWSLLLITGFCGGFTTFSTFSAENLTLIQSGNYFTAIAYILGSLLLGVLAVFAGFWLVK